MASQGTVKRSTLGSVGVSLSWPNLVSQTLRVLESSPPTLSGANLTSALALGQNEKVEKSDLLFQFVYDCFIRVDVKNALSTT